MLSPKYCLNCFKANDFYLCKKCCQQLNFRINFFCFECNKRIIGKCSQKNHYQLIKFFISFGEYENETLKKIVLLGKDKAKEIFKDLGYFISKDLLRYWQIFEGKVYFLTPVPLTKTKLVKRGFNQSEILAKIISELTGYKIFNGLEKIKETKDQAELDFKERLQNLKSAFKLKEKPPQYVILIDDIKTTGTTLKECARLLKENGTKEIIALTILR